MSGEITVILNSYKRPYMEEQYEAIMAQTVKPKNVWVWSNSPEEGRFRGNNAVTKTTPSVLCNTNFGVWARFAFALNADTEYVCIFDDDTIPGPRWFENCLETMKTHEGLLGTIGVIYDSEETIGVPARRYRRVGWGTPNESVERADIVGHSWFFKREWLSAYWRELPPPGMTTVGEDMHFSYTIQKYLGLNTYVPPHPKSSPEMWGSTKGSLYGTDSSALSMGPKVDAWSMQMDSYYKYLISKGFRIINATSRPKSR